jgi:hypothetical protein
MTVMRQREIEKQPTGNKARAAAQEQGRQATETRLAEADLKDTQPAFGRRTRVNAVKQKVRARKTGGGKPPPASSRPARKCTATGARAARRTRSNSGERT